MSLLFTDIDFAYSKKGKPILKGASLEVKPGHIAALLGNNGAGKTTIIRLLLGILKPNKGQISLNGVDYRDMKRNELSKQVAYVPQNPIFSNSMVIDAILLGRLPYSPYIYKKSDVEKAKEIIERLNLTPMAYQNAASLSGGEKQKVALGRALVNDAGLLLLDEPTAALDVKATKEVTEILKTEAKQGKAILACLHDIELAYRLADEFYLLIDETLVHIPNKEGLTEEQLRLAYGIDLRIKILDGELFVSYL